MLLTMVFFPGSSCLEIEPKTPGWRCCSLLQYLIQSCAHGERWLVQAVICFLTRLRYRPFSIGEIISHVLRPQALEPEISLSLFAYLPAFDIAPFSIELAPSSTRSHIQGEIISHVLQPLALEPEISLSLFAHFPCIP